LRSKFIHKFLIKKNIKKKLNKPEVSEPLKVYSSSSPEKNHKSNKNIREKYNK